MTYQSQQQIQPYQQSQPLQVEAQFWQGVVSFLITVALGAWVLSQMGKALRGEEVEKPF